MNQSNKEEYLSDYIDLLGSGQTKIPEEFKKNQDLFEMVQTARLIYATKEPELPSKEYIDRVASKIHSLTQQESKKRKSTLRKKQIKPYIIKLLPAVAVILLLLGGFLPNFIDKADAKQIAVLEESELIQLDQNQVENPSVIPGTNLISYAKSEQIWIWEPKTKKENALPLHNLLYMRNPAWSPDGTRVAFSGYEQGSAGIWVMNRDGSNLVKLSNPASIDENHSTPAWSPDGSKIAFTKTIVKSAETHGYTTVSEDIWLMNADGTNQQRLTAGSDPSFSPTGGQITYTKNTAEDESEVWTIAIDGNHAKKLTDGMEPAWAPNGMFIAFTKYVKHEKRNEGHPNISAITTFREVWAINVQSGELSQLTKGSQDQSEIDQFLSNPDNQNSDVPLQYVSSGAYGDWQPSWAEDGKSLLLSRNFNQENNAHFSLYRVKIDYQ